MLNPWMLLGLAGLSITVVIHLIQKQKLQPQMLATLRFLDPGKVSNVFAPVPRDVLQLLLRLILLGLFVLLMARLTTPSGDLGPRAMVVVLDQSMSMQRKVPGGGNLFGKHKADIGKLIDGMNDRDLLSLVLAGDTVTCRTQFLRDPAALRAVLADFEVTDGGGRAVAASVRRALERLQGLAHPNACVLVFSDHQVGNYRGKFEPGTFEKLLAGGRVRLALVEAPAEEKPNVAVQAGVFRPGRVYLGTSGKVSATVRSHAAKDQDVEVAFAEGDKAGERRSVALKPGETVSVDLAHFFEAPTDAACSVSVTDDVLPADNVFRAPMRVRDRRQVLLVAPARRRKERALHASYEGSDLLTYAMNPGEMLGTGTGTFIAVKRITPNLLRRVSLPIYSTVVLYGLADLEDKSVKDLLAYVRNGGGVYLVPDRSISPARFNETFAPLLAGLRLGGLKTPAEPAALSTNEATVTDPMLSPLRRGEWGEIDDVNFLAYFAPIAMGRARAALRAGNDDCLAAAIRLGLGTVFLQTFSCDIEDSTLPRSPAFVPMVQAVLDRLDTRDRETAADTLRANEVYRMLLPELRQLAGPVEFVGPRTHRFDLSAAERGTVKVDGIARAGAYRVRHRGKKGMRPRWLAVNAALGESDLARLSDRDQAKVFGPSNVARLPFERLASLFARRREVFPTMILLAFLAFAVEAVASAWGSRLKRGEAA